MLPTRRKAIHCPICDYYLTYKYESVKKCPWCGSDYKIINGDTGDRFRLMGSGNEGDKPLYAHDKSWKKLYEFLVE
jgi:ssDNA-binding Zn-finger/Zn-ribbon topoisomerase 1